MLEIENQVRLGDLELVLHWSDLKRV